MTDKYWVGGAATWDGTAGSKWALSSGGAGGQAVPTSSDNVFFDVLSTGTVTFANDATSCVCANLTFTGCLATFAYGGTSTVIQIAGNLTMAATTTWPTTSGGNTAFKFISTATGKTVTFAGKIPPNLTFDGVGGGWQFQDSAVTQSSGNTRTITLTNGSLDMNGQTVTNYAFASNNANTRTLTLGAAAISGGNDWNITDPTNLTYSGASATISLNLSSSNTFASGGLTYNSVTLRWPSSAGNTNTMTGAATFGTLDIQDIATSGGNAISLSANITVTGTFTFGANTDARRLAIISSVRGTRRTITAATVTVTRGVFQDIVGAGAGNWNLSAVTGGSGNAGNNSGITFTTPANIYWSGGTANWINTTRWFTATAGGGSATYYPMPQDTAIFDANSFSSGSQTVTINATTFYISNMNFTGVSNSPTMAFGSSSAAISIGSMTFVSGMTITSTKNMNLSGDNMTITLGGNTWPSGSALTFNTSGTITFADAFTLTGSTITYTLGTINMNAAFTGAATTIGVNCTVVTTSTLTVTTLTVNGSLTTGNTVTGTGALIIAGTLDATGDNLTGFTTFSMTASAAVFNCTNLTLSSTCTMQGGTVTVTGNVSATTYDLTGSTSRTINMGTGTWTSTGTGTVWSTLSATNITLNPSTAIVDFTNSSGTTRTITCSSIRTGSIKVSAGTGTVTCTNISCTGFDLTGFAGTFSGSTTLDCSGNLLLATGIVRSFTGAVTFSATATGKTITMATKSWGASAITFDGVGGGWTLQDDFTTTSSITLTNGALDTNGKAVSATIFASSNSNTRSLTLGATTFSLTSTGTVWDTSTATGLTITPNSGIIKLTNGTGTARTITGGSVNMGDLSVSAGSSALTMTNVVCNNFDWTGATGSIAVASNAVTVNGSLTLVAGMTQSSTATWTFGATATGKTITSAGKTLNAVTFDGVGGGWTLSGTLTVTNAITLTNGSLDTGGVAVSSATFSSGNSNTRSLTLGATTWSLTGTGSIWDCQPSTGMTLTANTSVIAITNTSGSTKTFAGGGLTYNKVTVASGTGLVRFNQSNTFNDTIAPTAPVSLRFFISTTQTLTNLAWVGSAGNLITIDSTSAGSPATLSVASGTLNNDYLSLQDSAATGGATFNAGSHSTNVSGNTGWIFSSPPASGFDAFLFAGD